MGCGICNTGCIALTQTNFHKTAGKPAKATCKNLWWKVIALLPPLLTPPSPSPFHFSSSFPSIILFLAFLSTSFTRSRMKNCFKEEMNHILSKHYKITVLTTLWRMDKSVMSMKDQPLASAPSSLQCWSAVNSQSPIPAMRHYLPKASQHSENRKDQHYH